MTDRIGLLGFGSYTPSRVMTNADWSALIDTTDEWIVTRTGIRERRFAADDETTVDLAANAAEKALADAGMTASDLDEIIVASDTPEVYTPDTAAHLQHRLGAREITAYDLGGSGCAGFVLALDVAKTRVQAVAKRILVVGVELISRLMDWNDRSTCVLFGDGAGAVVVGRGEDVKAELLSAAAGTDGSAAGILTLETGGTRRPFTLEEAQKGGQHDIVMNGREVYRQAVHRMADVAEKVLAQAGRLKEEIALVIPHQANLRIIDAVRSKLGLREDQVYVNVDRYGNTGSATVPLALDQARQEGRIKPGDLVVLTAFGAGFHWAGAVLQF
ncbi:MAG TPA: beta-ketoacyl-ACP synthase III [Acidimicrobiia bacterium]|nr:beta-ketoacyl-ACP synthase III [Acidimicrobiia bacterium]